MSKPKKTRKKETASHGGNRFGAGRPAPADPKRTVSFYLPGSLIDFIDEQPEARSEYLIKILKRQLSRQILKR